MSYANGTTHYNLPQTTGTDKRDWSDTNQAFSDVDAALYGAVQDTAQAELDIDALEARMDTAEQNIADNAGDIAALDGRVTTAEGTITQHTAQIADVRQDTEDMICAYNEASATSTHAYSVGDYFIYNDVLYRASQTIAIGDTIVPDTNCTTTNVSAELLNKAEKAHVFIYYGANFASIDNMISAIRANLLSINGYNTKKVDLYWAFNVAFNTMYHMSQIDSFGTDNPVIYFTAITGNPTNVRCRYIRSAAAGASQGEYQIATGGTTSSTVDVTEAPTFNVMLVVG